MTSATPANPADASGTRPVPDPTVLTTEALLREVGHLKELMDEKFVSMAALMERAEEQRREQKLDTRSAVDAALQAQKEATSKMETSVSDQLSALRTNFDTSILSVITQLSDLKDRVTTIVSEKAGSQEQRIETRAITAGQIAAIGAAIALAGLLIGLFVYIGGTP